MAAVADPFDPRALGACVPVANATASAKMCVRTVVTVTIGTGSYGYVAICPNPTKDAPQAVYTSATYTGSTIETATATAGVEEAYFSQLPYAAADLSGATCSVGGRVVSFGARIRYIGTANDMGGMCAAIVSPDREDFDGQNFSEITSLRNAAIFPSTTDPFTITMYPTSAEEALYSNSPNAFLYPFGRNVGSSSAPPVGGVIMISGKSGNTYQVELLAHVEYTGRSISYMSQPTDSDADGYSQVCTLAANFQDLKAQQPSMDTSALLRGAMSIVRQVQPEHVYNALTFGVSYLLSRRASALVMR